MRHHSTLGALALALLLSSAAPASSGTFDHFAGSSLPSAFRPKTAGGGAICAAGKLVAGPGGCSAAAPGRSELEHVTSAPADVSAIEYAPLLDKTRSRTVWITLRTLSGTSTVWLLDAPAGVPAGGYTTAALDGASGVALSRVQVTSTKVVIARFDASSSRVRSEWNASNDTWGTPAKSAATAALDTYLTLGLEVDGALQRYRWHVIGAAGTTSGPPNYGLYQSAMTDWVAFAFHEGGAANYCKPTCTALRFLVGDPLTDGGSQRTGIEWFADDDGKRREAWANGRNVGGGWDIYRLWGNESTAGHVQRWVSESRTAPAFANGAAGAWDDIHVKDPQVVQDTATGIFHMCYSGANATFQAGCASAATSAGPWIRSPKNPIVRSVPGTTEHQVANPFLLKDLAEPNPAKRWKLFTIGVDNSTTVNRSVYVRTCAEPPNTCAAWSPRLLLAGPGAPGDIDDLGWLRVMPIVIGGVSYLVGSVSQDRAIDLRQVTFGSFAGRWQSPLQKSGIVTLGSQLPICNTQTTSATTMSRNLSVVSTAGCKADRWILLDDDASTGNYHRNRILRVVDATHLELYHREDGLSAGAVVRGSDGFVGIDAALPIASGSQWIQYATCYNPMSDTPIVRAYAEQVCLFTAASPLGPWRRDLLGSPAAMPIAGRLHSYENMTLITTPVGGGTPVPGSLAADTEWTRAGSPYVLTGNLTVETGATLTIAPGVIVKAQGARALEIHGTLRAIGSAAHPIVFTSELDDSAVGDSNDDGGATLAAPRDWSGVHFAAGSSGSLDFVEIRNAGAFGSASLGIETSNLTFANGVIHHGGDVGIWVAAAAPAITSTLIEGHVAGIRLEGAAALLEGNEIRGNGIGVEAHLDAGSVLRGNAIAGNAVLGALNDSAGQVLTATGNYWGDASGSLDRSDDSATGGLFNPAGRGDGVSDLIDYGAWLTTDPSP